MASPLAARRRALLLVRVALGLACMGACGAVDLDGLRFRPRNGLNETDAPAAPGSSPPSPAIIFAAIVAPLTCAAALVFVGVILIWRRRSAGSRRVGHNGLQVSVALRVIGW